MSRIARRAFAALVVCGFVAPAVAADRPADEIVKEIEGIQPPKTRAESLQVQKKHAALVGELLKAHPDDPRLAGFLPQRWMILATSGKSGEALAEIDTRLAAAKDETQKVDATFLKARVVLIQKRLEPEEATPAIDAFLALAPKDPRGSMLLFALYQAARDPARKETLEERILKEYPDSPYAVAIRGPRIQKEGIGKPFDLEFTDAINGKTVSIKGLKGKVVVVDFWATWCGPCIAELPKMKTIYAEYKDKGVEFVGVSLDQPKEKGGLDKLKAFVAEREIPWPQYYQGNFWDSEFSRSWGVTAIPCVFIVDADGKLHSTEAGGPNLEPMIKELLARRDKNAAGGGQ
ncbi:MAG TPA: redoxin family protein [Isosphaeraceae bacterium]